MGDGLVSNSSSMAHQHHDCHFVNPVNLFLIFSGAVGLILNIFPLYVIFKIQIQKPRAGRDVLLAALCIIDILTLLVPLSIYLSVQDECVSGANDTKSVISRPWICEMFFLMFMWLKLSAMFLITTMNYSSYLALNVKGQYGNNSSSIGDRLSNSLWTGSKRSSSVRMNVEGKSPVVIANLVIGIALVAFVISSLPYLGLGPKGKHAVSNSTHLPYRRNSEVQLCQLEQISYPLKGKEYTFLFAVLMSSAACLLLHLVHSVFSCFSCCFWNKNLKQAQELDIQVVNTNRDAPSNGGIRVAKNVHGITDSYARMTFFLGIVFFATWVPLMVSMGTLMSQIMFNSRFGEFALAGTFGNQFIGPLIYAAFLKEFRDGYTHLLSKMFSMVNIFTDFILLTKKQKALTQASEERTRMKVNSS